LTFFFLLKFFLPPRRHTTKCRRSAIFFFVILLHPLMSFTILKDPRAGIHGDSLGHLTKISPVLGLGGNFAFYFFLEPFFLGAIPFFAIFFYSRGRLGDSWFALSILIVSTPAEFCACLCGYVCDVPPAPRLGCFS